MEKQFLRARPYPTLGYYFRKAFQKKSVFIVSLFVFALKIHSQEIPQLDTLTLNNGLRVYLLSSGEDSVLNIRLIIDGGKKNETQCQVGYSEIVQQVLNQTFHEKQNSGLKKERVICEIRDGQQIVSSNCSNKDLNKKVELISTTLSSLAFTKHRMDKVVASIIDHYKIENISAVCLAGIYRNQVVYSTKNPLGRSYCQYQLEKALPEDLREFYNANYTPKRASLVICGNFNVRDVKKTIAKHFIKWRAFHKEDATKKGRDLKTPKITGREIVFVNKRDSERCLLKWVLSAPDFKSPDHLSFLVTGKLFDKYLADKIKESKDLFDVSLPFKPLSYAGDLMELNCIANPIAMTYAIQLVDTALQNFHKLKLNNADLEEVLNSLKEGYLINETPKAVLSFFDPLLYNFEVRRNYLANLSRVKPEDIQALLKKYFMPDSYKLIIVGKEDAVSNQLNLLRNLTRYGTSDFEACDEGCKEVIVIKCHCESCYRRGQVHIWRFDPKDKGAIKSARARAKASWR